MNDRNGPSEGFKGVVEDLKGKAKEALGALKGDRSLEREGEAQQDKAESQREASAREAQAEKARREADLHETRQRFEQS